MARSYILLRSGTILDLDQPDPSAWTDEELAERLGQTCRWTGSTRWARPLSVAQHSILVLHLLGTGGHRPGRQEQLAALLHDAEEGLIGFDPVTPVKAMLGPAFLELSARLKAAIGERYSLHQLTRDQLLRQKAADRFAAALEARHVVGWKAADIRDRLGLPTINSDIDPLFSGSEAEEGYRPWEPWTAAYAAGQFHVLLRALTCNQRSREPCSAWP